MTKDQLLAIARANHDAQETFYINNGPNKHVQEDHYTTGVAVVGMNVELLTQYLDGEDTDNDQDDATDPEDSAHDSFEALPPVGRREVWEASNFHFGIVGYETRDADFWWDEQ